MTVPAAPTEGGGDKIIFLMYDDAGSNDAAIMRAIAVVAINGEPAAHMAVASHEDGDTLAGANDPVLLVAGADDAGVVRPLLVDANGRLAVDLVEATLGGSGHTDVAVTGTRVALRATTAIREVLLKADADNTGILYVGGATVTNDGAALTGGFRLAAGQEVRIPASDLAGVYINGAANDGCSYLYWT